jgi:hypothetical protein
MRGQRTARLRACTCAGWGAGPGPGGGGPPPPPPPPPGQDDTLYEVPEIARVVRANITSEGRRRAGCTPGGVHQRIASGRTSPSAGAEHTENATPPATPASPSAPPPPPAPGYLRDELGVPADKVEATTLRLYQSHGTTMCGLVAEGHVIDYDHFHSMARRGVGGCWVLGGPWSGEGSEGGAVGRCLIVL